MCACVVTPPGLTPPSLWGLAALMRRFTALGLSYNLAADLVRVKHASPSLAVAVLRALHGQRRESGMQEERYTSLQAAFKLAFKVHQFAGGFDAETEREFNACAAELLQLSRERAVHDSMPQSDRQL